MKYTLKNDDGIECHFDKAERKLIYNALRCYSAFGKENKYIDEQIPKICEILNVFDLPEFAKINY